MREKQDIIKEAGTRVTLIKEGIFGDYGLEMLIEGEGFGERG